MWWWVKGFGALRGQILPFPSPSAFAIVLITFSHYRVSVWLLHCDWIMQLLSMRGWKLCCVPACHCCGWWVPWVILPRCCQCFWFPSVLWHCWLGGRKGIQCVKTCFSYPHPTQYEVTLWRKASLTTLHVHRVSEKTANCFLSEFPQISTNFDNFWQKDDKEAKIIWGVLIFHLY